MSIFIVVEKNSSFKQIIQSRLNKREPNSAMLIFWLNQRLALEKATIQVRYKSSLRHIQSHDVFRPTFWPNFGKIFDYCLFVCFFSGKQHTTIFPIYFKFMYITNFGYAWNKCKNCNQPQCHSFRLLERLGLIHVYISIQTKKFGQNCNVLILRLSVSKRKFYSKQTNTGHSNILSRNRCHMSRHWQPCFSI